MGSSAPTLLYLAVLAWAEWHHGVITRQELGDLGVPATTIVS